jgi:hypothetical protein
MLFPMSIISEFPWQQDSIIRQTQRLLSSFQHWVGRPLLAIEASPEAQAQVLFEAPFVVVSHGTEPDPIFNYGNQQALMLWEMDWPTFTQTPSRQSAAPPERGEREQLLATARAKGFVDHYRGLRTSSQGKQFWIENALLWTVLQQFSVWKFNWCWVEFLALTPQA